jgi:hypothetical protein
MSSAQPGPQGRIAPSLMAEAFQLAGARPGHTAHAFAGIEPGDDALAQAAIQARMFRF